MSCVREPSQYLFLMALILVVCVPAAVAEAGTEAVEYTAPILEPRLEGLDQVLKGFLSEWGGGLGDAETFFIPRMVVLDHGFLLWEERRLKLKLPWKRELSYYREELEALLAMYTTDVLSAEEKIKDTGRQLIYRLGFPGHYSGADIEGIVTHQLVIHTPFFRPGQRGQLALIIDDIGYFAEGFEEFLALPRELTAAVLPNRPRSREQIQLLQEHQIPYLLHLPMEADNPELDPGYGTVRVDHSPSQIEDMITINLEHVPGAVGVNNHMGSKATADPDVMRVVLSELKEHGLFFVDSSTAPRSVISQVGDEVGIPVLINNLFIDNNRDVDYIKGQLGLLSDIAGRRGRAIGIGHVFPETMQAIEEMIPVIEARGIELVTVCEFLPE